MSKESYHIFVPRPFSLKHFFNRALLNDLVTMSLAEYNQTLATNATMRGVVYNGVPYEMVVENLPVPTLDHSNDAIVRITTSALCGSDLHIYHGVSGAGTPPWIMGHEAMGYVAAIGEGVSSLSVGDYVVIPDTPHWGHIAMEPENLPYFGVGRDDLSGLQSKPIPIESLLNTKF